MKALAITVSVLCCGVPWAGALTMYLIGYFTRPKGSPSLIQRKWWGFHDMLRIIVAPLVAFNFAYLFWLRRDELRERIRASRLASSL